MKVLFISAVTPYPLTSGGQIRIYQLLKRLGKRHKITLLAYCRTNEEQIAVSKLAQYCFCVKLFYRGRVWNPKYLTQALTSSNPLLMASYHQSGIEAEVRNHVGEFDVVHAEPFYVHRVVPDDAKIKLVLSEHNIEYEVYGDFVSRYRHVPVLAQAMHYDVWKLKRAEQAAWKRAKQVVAVSQSDKEVISKVVPAEKITIAPNSVDSEYFKYESRLHKARELNFLFVGDFTWPPNIAAVHELLGNIWPYIARRYNDARLTIIGRGFPRALRDIVKKHSVEVIARVDDIRVSYQAASALLAPIHIAGGTKFKVLEAMASGLPIITTREGVYGLSPEAENVVFLVKDAEDYIKAIDILHKDKDRVSAMTQAARKLVEKNYNWDVTARLVESAWHKAYENA